MIIEETKVIHVSENNPITFELRLNEAMEEYHQMANEKMEADFEIKHSTTYDGRNCEVIYSAVVIIKGGL